jgi:hypothetical protein
MVNLYVALVHYPVVNRQGDTIASAVTNLDLHDIARSARTYGVKAFYVVTPLTDQIKLVETIVSHWTEGPGGRHNPKRREALSLIRIEESLSGVVGHIGEQGAAAPRIVVTSAKKRSGSIDYERLREMIQTGEPYLLVFGTGWGLSDQVMDGADYFLQPVSGPVDYNHLSVRSAAAIILDRLIGC